MVEEQGARPAFGLDGEGGEETAFVAEEGNEGADFAETRFVDAAVQVVGEKVLAHGGRLKDRRARRGAGPVVEDGGEKLREVVHRRVQVPAATKDFGRFIVDSRRVRNQIGPVQAEMRDQARSVLGEECARGSHAERLENILLDVLWQAGPCDFLDDETQVVDIDAVDVFGARMGQQRRLEVFHVSDSMVCRWGSTGLSAPLAGRGVEEVVREARCVREELEDGRW